jgi:hypothetical protein
VRKETTMAKTIRITLDDDAYARLSQAATARSTTLERMFRAFVDSTAGAANEGNESMQGNQGKVAPVSGREADEVPADRMRGGRPNPLKAWADTESALDDAADDEPDEDTDDRRTRDAMHGKPQLRRRG